MAVDFAPTNAANIRAFGITVTFHRAGGQAEDVTVIKSSPSAFSGQLVLAQLFGTMADSGFTYMPAKNDKFIISGEEFRAFEVLGPDEAGGIHISLAK